jgi:phthiocerol/phenolphthiocerol synthesis type-I polyketide synthase D
MARRYVKAISTVQDPGSKLILLGWSFGGAVAFEMARLLPEMGIEVELVFLDCRLPVTASTVVGVDRRLLRASILFEHLAGVSESKFSLAELRHLPLHDQLRLVAERTGIEVEDLVPKDMGYSGLERYLEMRTARIEALEKYEFRPQAVNATLFRAEDLGQPVLIPELGRAFEHASQTPDYGWGQLCLGALKILSIACTHDSILAEPHVQQVARELTTLGEPARATSTCASVTG